MLGIASLVSVSDLQADWVLITASSLVNNALVPYSTREYKHHLSASFHLIDIFIVKWSGNYFAVLFSVASHREPSQNPASAKMAPNEPLFTTGRRDSSIHSEDRAADEDTALLRSRGVGTSASPGSKYSFWREIGLFSWAVVATAAFIVLAVVSQHQGQHGEKKPTATGKRNLIFMVSDGMGPASLSMTRSFRQLTRKISSYLTVLI